MELLIIVALLCLGIAAHPFAAKRFSPLVQGTLGSLCVGVSLALTSLLASGLVALPSPLTLGSQAQAAALPDIDRPTPPSEASPSPAQPAVVPNDESRFFAPADQTSEGIEINTPEEISVIIPPGRPTWVEQAPQREGSIHSNAICSDPYATHQQAIQALDEKLQVATSAYIKEHLQSDLAPSLIRLSLADIKQQLVESKNVYHEKIHVSIGPMHQVHALLEFKPEFREMLDRRWGELQATYRLAETGLISGGVLLLLGTVFGYFRLDNATRGYYTGRLQFMAAAAILAIVASGAMFSRWIHWL